MSNLFGRREMILRVARTKFAWVALATSRPRRYYYLRQTAAFIQSMAPFATANSARLNDERVAFGGLGCIRPIYRVLRVFPLWLFRS